MMHVVYFRRTYYGTELWVPTMGNQGSTGYPFSCQSLAACPGSVPGVLDRGTGHARYSSKTHALHWQAVKTTITLFDMWDHGCGMGHS